MNESNQDNFFEKYLSGRELFGDDFSQEEINKWYEDEVNSGYENLVFSTDKIYKYEYHALNIFHGFDKIMFDISGLSCLCFGSPSGDEIIPILNKIKTLDLLDASDGFNKIDGVSIFYSKPNSSGVLPYQDDSFDLITCLGVLHHIPNVSFVVSELRRVLKPGGYILIREPITSMGDWRTKRKNVTKRERGIPEKKFIDIVSENFKNLKISYCIFPPLQKACNFFKVKPYLSKITVYLDFLLSSLFSFNSKYHRTNFLSKFAPASLYIVCQK